MSVIIKEAYEYGNEIKKLFNEYTEMLIKNDHNFKCYLKMQNYDKEIENLKNKYGKPKGRLYIAFVDEKPAGCIGLKYLNDESCEMKRLYVRDDFRGNNIGKMLVEKIIDEAYHIGYKYMFLDTLPFLKSAVHLYKKAGFYETECYNNSPMKSSIFLKLNLKK